MNHKYRGIKLFRVVAKPWVLTCAIAGFCADTALADLAGAWKTTALSRVDVTPINAPGLIPEHRVAVYDGQYTFYDDGSFNAEQIDSTWRQKKKQYTVKVNRFSLENQFRESLRAEAPGIEIRHLKLVKSSFTGYELDDGIWGSEQYEYKIDTVFEGYHDIYRLVMTLRVAGKPDTGEAETAARTFAVQNADVQPVHNTAIDQAVAAVLTHIKQRKLAAQ